MSKPFKILVPIGFSEQSLIALEHAQIFGKNTPQTELTLLSVIEEQGGLWGKMFAAKKDEEEMRDEISKKLKALAAEASAQSGLAIDTMVARGLVYEEIARVSELIEADLVVMGTNGKPQNLRKRFIGSNAYRTVTLVKPPVVTIKGIREFKKLDTIIFPLVLDRRSKEKVGPALKFARLFDAKIKIVSVLKNADEEKLLRANLNQVHKFIQDHGVDCDARLINPQDTGHKGIVRNTLNFAYENDGDLLIITEDSRQRDVSDYFLGTDVQGVIYHSEIPVMSITPSEVKWRAMWDSF